MYEDMASPVDVLNDLDLYLSQISPEELEEEEEKGDWEPVGDACMDCRNSYSPLVSATNNGHKECLKEILETRTALGRDLASVRCESEATLAHLAARRGDRETLSMILTADRSLCEVGDIRGATPLHVCAYHGYIDCLSLLIENGSLADHRDQDGAAAAHFAAASGHLDCLKELVQEGKANPNAQTFTGETPGRRY